LTRDQLVAEIFKKKSFLCVGLDPDLQRIPASLGTGSKAIVAFHRAIIEATKDYCVAYKPNLAFFEALGAEGWHVFQETVALIPDTHFIIADAKRGDIGNTSRHYADAFFKQLNCDAVTVAPYMGKDSVSPFLEMEGHWTIVLALTSNPGAADFELQQLLNGKRVFEEVIDRAMEWGSPDQLMFVAGATRAEELAKIRNRAPDYFLLIPGVGAQGGDLESVARASFSSDVGILVNASRSILYASTDVDFADAARIEAQLMQQEMERLLNERFAHFIVQV
jgi:orotidine-5'-phosphate decarboxylase